MGTVEPGPSCMSIVGNHCIQIYVRALVKVVYTNKGKIYVHEFVKSDIYVLSILLFCLRMRG